MRKEKLIIDFLIDKRLGRRDDYSIPETTTFLPPSRIRNNRLVASTDGECSITLPPM